MASAAFLDPRRPPAVNRCATAPENPLLSFQPVGVSYRSTAKADAGGFSEGGKPPELQVGTARRRANPPVSSGLNPGLTGFNRVYVHRAASSRVWSRSETKVWPHFPDYWRILFLFAAFLVIEVADDLLPALVKGEGLIWLAGTPPELPLLPTLADPDPRQKPGPWFPCSRTTRGRGGSGVRRVDWMSSSFCSLSPPQP